MAIAQKYTEKRLLQRDRSVHAYKEKGKCSVIVRADSIGLKRASYITMGKSPVFKIIPVWVQVSVPPLTKDDLGKFSFHICITGQHLYLHQRVATKKH